MAAIIIALCTVNVIRVLAHAPKGGVPKSLKEGEESRLMTVTPIWTRGAGRGDRMGQCGCGRAWGPGMGRNNNNTLELMVTCTCSTMSKQHSKHGRRKGGVSRSEDQAQAMLKWAVDDMRLSTDTLPSLEDLNT